MAKYAMSCKNPNLCQKKYTRWKEHQEQSIPIGEREHELFLDHVNKRNATLDLSIHANTRQTERVINSHDIRDIIKHGWVIERSFFSNISAVRITLHGYTRQYRPIHVVCEIIRENHWKVITVYNPKSMAYKWSNDFQERICFCK